MDSIIRLLFGIKKTRSELAMEDAMVCIDEGNILEAIDILSNKVLKHDPENQKAKIHLAVAYIKNNDILAARDLLEPIAAQRKINSDVAMAQIALDKIKKEYPEA